MAAPLLADLMLQTAKLLSQLIFSMKLEDELSIANVMDSKEEAQSDNEQDSDFEEEKKGSSSASCCFCCTLSMVESLFYNHSRNV